MSMSSVQLAFYNWVQGQLVLMPSSIKAIWSNSNSPRPPLPYVVMQITGMSRMCKDFVSEVLDDLGNAELTTLHEITFNLSCYYSGDGSHLDAFDVLDYLRLSLLKEDVGETLNAAKITLLSANSDILFLPEVIATGFESRATMDIKFGTVTSVQHNVGLIETVEGSGVNHNGSQEITINYTASKGA